MISNILAGVIGGVVMKNIKEKYDIQYLKSVLYTGMISDILDKLGYRNQTLDSGIKPVDENFVLFGKAYTVSCVEVNDMPNFSLRKQLEAIDGISEDEVYTITLHGSEKCALWGELLSNCIIKRGAVGALIDGVTRDVKQIRELKFPVFARGNRPTSSVGRMEVFERQLPIEIGEVKIFPGDYIFGDIDGVVIIPKDLIEVVIEQSVINIKEEDKSRQLFLEGSSALEVYERIGVM